MSNKLDKKGEQTLLYKIKELRLEKGMSQDALSKKARVSRQIISNLENHKEVTTTTETLSRLANALDKKVSDLFFEESV